METALYKVRGLLEGNGSIPVYITLDAYKKLLAEKKKMNNVPVSTVLTAILEKYNEIEAKVTNQIYFNSKLITTLAFAKFVGSMAQPGRAPDS